ncbi:PPK2 family polyphosphate kinase [Ottowia sp.]|uniref:PPK2 family polyphosphate kinase n=1 Tax=Ottowia sp. TaxID=1898956 RepID=UPI002CF73228|nr:PPK2 family polyphosphate kinase [Ottowia sp.]HOB67436.1 polyphosphate--nucleotide phosphotransferase [Ottowia sp.]HPZ58218.1 polyphosphate--nucleotide phosphotransferase [Ottowia sp.]HQD48470.1 polyphosphate--nucleotide phosphotransferase [Ottowia sp.]
MAKKTDGLAKSDRKRWQVPVGGKGFTLKDCDPGAKPFSSGDKETDKSRVSELANEIDALQDVFWADRRFKLLVLLQGTDTAGKDGTIRAVFKETSPLGVRAVGWKAPTEVERSYDFLWRIHAQMPHAGEFMIHNRSHYEDVLVPVVEQWIDGSTTEQRYRQINDFERMLTETGTVILKFMLHISEDEQRQRLQERVDDPTKHWKFSMGDLDTRKQWPRYQKAYDNLLRATSTEWAPWVVVPADSKTHRNLMIATLVRDKLKALQLRYPPDNPQLKGLIVK